MCVCVHVCVCMCACACECVCVCVCVCVWTCFECAGVSGCAFHALKQFVVYVFTYMPAYNQHTHVLTSGICIEFGFAGGNYCHSREESATSTKS